MLRLHKKDLIFIGGVEKHRLNWWYVSAAEATKHHTQLSETHLGRCELSHSLGTLRHSVLGELTREHKAHGSLHFSGGQSGLLVVTGKTSSFVTEALEHVVDERVHDAHALLGDTSLGVHLLQHTVDVGGVGLCALGVALWGGSLLGGLLSWSTSHVDRLRSDVRSYKFQNWLFF